MAIPDEYQMGFSSRKAIYIPYPQAVPSSFILNMDDCLGNNPIACGKCAEVCEQEAINYDDQDEIITREVGAVIVAIGLDVYNPSAERRADAHSYSPYQVVAFYLILPVTYGYWRRVGTSGIFCLAGVCDDFSSPPLNNSMKRMLR